MRVVVPFGRGRKLYSGLVHKIHDLRPSVRNVREVVSVLDVVPIVTKEQLDLWKVMADRLTQSWTSVPHFFLARDVDAKRFTKWHLNAQERSQTQLANDQLGDLMSERYKLEHECDEEVNALGERYRPESLTLEAIEVPCRKGDVKVNLLALLWIPYEIDANGMASPLVALPK